MRDFTRNVAAPLLVIGIVALVGWAWSALFNSQLKAYVTWNQMILDEKVLDLLGYQPKSTSFPQTITRKNAVIELKNETSFRYTDIEIGGADIVYALSGSSDSFNDPKALPISDNNVIVPQAPPNSSIFVYLIYRVGDYPIPFRIISNNQSVNTYSRVITSDWDGSKTWAVNSKIYGFLSFIVPTAAFSCLVMSVLYLGVLVFRSFRSEPR